MKSIIGYSVAAILGVVLWVWRAYNPYPLFYNNSGQIVGQNMKFFVAKMPITAANQTFSLSAAGFSVLSSVTVTPQFNTSTAASMPLASIQTSSPTSVTVNFLQSNTQTISILGTVAVGLQSLQSFSGDTCQIVAIGY